MPKFKKPPKNDFSFFLEDRKRELEAKGYRFKNGMRDVVPLVQGEWKTLDPEKKAHYKQMAKEWKEKDKTNLDNKFTCSGESYAAMLRRRQIEEEEKKNLKELFQMMVMCEKPEERIFMLMHAIPSCEVTMSTMPSENDKKEYYPLEFAISAFSLQDGLICSMWNLVNTVEVPTGYMSDAKTVQEDTLLPLPGSSEFDDDAPNATRYVEILGGFRKFVETWGGDYPDERYMIFAADQTINAARGSIEWLVKNVDENRRENQEFLSRLQFYSLPLLYIELCVMASMKDPNYRSEIAQFRNIENARVKLGHGRYEYKTEITCPYHKKGDNSQKMHLCCANFIQRRVFLMLDEFVSPFQISVTSQHKIEHFRKEIPERLKPMLSRPAARKAPAPQNFDEVKTQRGDDTGRNSDRNPSHRTGSSGRGDRDRNYNRADYKEEEKKTRSDWENRGKQESNYDRRGRNGRDSGYERTRRDYSDERRRRNSIDDKKQDDLRNSDYRRSGRTSRDERYEGRDHDSYESRNRSYSHERKDRTSRYYHEARRDEYETKDRKNENSPAEHSHQNRHGNASNYDRESKRPESRRRDSLEFDDRRYEEEKQKPEEIGAGRRAPSPSSSPEDGELPETTYISKGSPDRRHSHGSYDEAKDVKIFPKNSTSSGDGASVPLTENNNHHDRRSSDAGFFIKTEPAECETVFPSSSSQKFGAPAVITEVVTIGSNVKRERISFDVSSDGNKASDDDEECFNAPKKRKREDMSSEDPIIDSSSVSAKSNVLDEAADRRKAPGSRIPWGIPVKPGPGSSSDEDSPPRTDTFMGRGRGLRQGSPDPAAHTEELESVFMRPLSPPRVVSLQPRGRGRGFRGSSCSSTASNNF